MRIRSNISYAEYLAYILGGFHPGRQIRKEKIQKLNRINKIEAINQIIL
jgi:hypothetical protein